MQYDRSLAYRARYLCVTLVLAGLSHFAQSCEPPLFDSLCPECGAEEGAVVGGCWVKRERA